MGSPPQSAKMHAIKSLPSPTNIPSLRSALGLCGYYRKFCPNHSRFTHRLNHLMRKGVAWSWTADHEADFRALIDELCTEGRALRKFDPARPVL